MNISLNLPVNRTSFGQTSVLILKTLKEREESGQFKAGLSLFPIGEVDLSAEKKDENFQNWINSKIQFGIINHNKITPTFKLWHLSGGLDSYSNDQTLLSFYELDSPTPAELNVAENNKLAFSSKYTCEVFKQKECNCFY